MNQLVVFSLVVAIVLVSCEHEDPGSHKDKRGYDSVSGDGIRGRHNKEGARLGGTGFGGVSKSGLGKEFSRGFGDGHSSGVREFSDEGGHTNERGLNIGISDGTFGIRGFGQISGADFGEVTENMDERDFGGGYEETPSKRFKGNNHNSEGFPSTSSEGTDGDQFKDGIGFRGHNEGTIDSGLGGRFGGLADGRFKSGLNQGGEFGITSHTGFGGVKIKGGGEFVGAFDSGLEDHFNGGVGFDGIAGGRFGENNSKERDEFFGISDSRLGKEFRGENFKEKTFGGFGKSKIQGEGEFGSESNDGFGGGFKKEGGFGGSRGGGFGVGGQVKKDEFARGSSKGFERSHIKEVGFGGSNIKGGVGGFGGVSDAGFTGGFSNGEFEGIHDGRLRHHIKVRGFGRNNFKEDVEGFGGRGLEGDIIKGGGYGGNYIFGGIPSVRFGVGRLNGEGIDDASGSGIREHRKEIINSDISTEGIKRGFGRTNGIGEFRGDNVKDGGGIVSYSVGGIGVGLNKGVGGFGSSSVGVLEQGFGRNSGRGLESSEIRESIFAGNSGVGFGGSQIKRVEEFGDISSGGFGKEKDKEREGIGRFSGGTLMVSHSKDKKYGGIPSSRLEEGHTKEVESFSGSKIGSGFDNGGEGVYEGFIGSRFGDSNFKDRILGKSGFEFERDNIKGSKEFGGQSSRGFGEGYSKRAGTFGGRGIGLVRQSATGSFSRGYGI